MQVLYCKKNSPPPPTHTHTPYGPLFVCAYNVASSLLESLILRVLFRDVDGVIKRANATEYGLASGVFTKDLSKVCERSTTVYVDEVMRSVVNSLSYKLLYFRTNSELWKTTILAINYRFLCIFCPPPACLLPPFNVAVRFYSLRMWNKNCSTYRSSKGRSVVPDLSDKPYHNMHANVFRWC